MRVLNVQDDSLILLPSALFIYLLLLTFCAQDFCVECVGVAPVWILLYHCA